MNLYLSSATILSYENHTQSMDLFYSPTLIFDGIDFERVKHLDDIVFTIESDIIGKRQFDIQQINKATIKESETRCYLEFRLSKHDVPFQYDNYDCTLTFSALLEGKKVEYSTVGIVKTKWKKGLV